MLTVSRSVSAAPNAPARALAVEGKPAATLVIPKEASDQEALAAREIQEWVRKMSGAELTIRRPLKQLAVPPLQAIHKGSMPQSRPDADSRLDVCEGFS